MTAHLGFTEILRNVSPTYKSVEVRTVSANLSNKWRNLVTIVRMSDATVEQRSLSMKEEWSKHASLDCDELQLKWACLPFSELDTVTRAFEGGQLTFYASPVSLERPVNLGGMKGYINRYGIFIECTEWPAFEGSESWFPDATNQELVTTARKLQSFVQSPEIRHHVETRGFRSFKEVLHLFLGFRSETEPTYCSDVYVSAPVFARIQGGRIDLAIERLSVSVRAHPEIIGLLKVHGNAFDNQNRTERLRFSIQPGADEWARTASSDYRTRDREGRVEARIVHERLGDVYSEVWCVRELVPQVELNPLWHVLRRFCSPDRLEKLLSEPIPLPDDQSKAQRLFEMHVTWLLACHGFRNRRARQPRTSASRRPKDQAWQSGHRWISFRQEDSLACFLHDESAERRGLLELVEPSSASIGGNRERCSLCHNYGYFYGSCGLRFDIELDKRF